MTHDPEYESKLPGLVGCSVARVLHDAGRPIVPDGRSFPVHLTLEFEDGSLLDVWCTEISVENTARREERSMSKIWSCKIGEVDANKLPDGADLPMRQAIERAYLEITGEEPDFILSGWGAELDKYERNAVTPRPEE